MDKKGTAAGVWGGVILLLILVAIVYIALNEPFVKVKDSTSSLITDSNHTGTVNKLSNIWTNWPIFVFIIILFSGFIALSRRDSDPYT